MRNNIDSVIAQNSYKVLDF